MQPYWHRQTVDNPLFPNLLWSQPENKLMAGKLLLVGGSAQSFARPAEAFGLAEKAGVGVVRILLPDVLSKTVGKIFPAAEFAPSTPSGSFASQALGELLPASMWSDAVLLAGDFGRNSETAIMLEKFAEKYHGQLTLVGDSVDYFISTPLPLQTRSETLIIATFQQLQKLAQALRFTTAFTSTMDFIHFVTALHEFTKTYNLHIVINHAGNCHVAVNGDISSTKPETSVSELQIAARAATWWLQNPSKPFAAISTGLLA